MRAQAIEKVAKALALEILQPTDIQRSKALACKILILTDRGNDKSASVIREAMNS